MDWKKRYNMIKEGDEVRIIKSNHLCKYNVYGCCDKYVGKIGTVRHIDTEENQKFGKCNVKLSSGDNCNFPQKCLEKVQQ